MAIQQSYLQVPLTDDDKDMLQTIYSARIRLFLITYTVLFIMALICGYCIDSRDRRHLDKFSMYEYNKTHGITKWEDTNEDKGISRMQMRIISISFLESVVIATGIVVFLRRIQPFKADLKLGMKAKVPYVIVRKEYFPLTNQCYVGFDDPSYLHHEIDQDTFSQVNEGDVMYIYRGIKSKYTFEENGKFSLM